MSHFREPLLLAACLLGAGVGTARIASPAYGSDFTNFAQDENVCRQAGADAIKGASGPAAARRYDFAHWQCMAAHGRSRMMGAYAQGGPPGVGRDSGPPDNSEFPDAYYHIPYATPGYGYDGFSY